jgi:hypothetical protein
MLNYRTATCPRMVAPFYVGVECPAALFPLLHQRPAKALDISVTLIRVGPPGYFIHVSITTPIASAMKNYYA